MFARGIPTLSGSSIDVGNVNIPRLQDALSDAYTQAAQRALIAEPVQMTLSQRLNDPARYAQIRHANRQYLEALLWVDANQDVLDRIADLADLICSENTWSAAAHSFDDPAHPVIDCHAAETGMLLAWTLRRHGAQLNEMDPRLPVHILNEVRRRLFAPLMAHDDYPFMHAAGRYPALILSDLALTCLFLERNSSRRFTIIKKLMHRLDSLCIKLPSSAVPLEERLADACAIADLARLLKRITRGEIDYTRSQPTAARLDDILIPWVCAEYFIDPAGDGLCPQISGMDIFRLGYLSRDHALSALGAQIHRARKKDAFSLCGRILSMEYAYAAQEEYAAPPRLKRAVGEDNALMVSRADGFFAGLSCTANAGCVTLFLDSTPILVDAGTAAPHPSLPIIDGHLPIPAPVPPVSGDFDFNETRDLMTAELTGAYSEKCAPDAYQRTLMIKRGESCVHMIDAFEFAQPPGEIIFRFITAVRPLILRDNVRLGPVTLSWDGEMIPSYAEIDDDTTFPERCFELHLALKSVQPRQISAFRFTRS